MIKPRFLITAVAGYLLAAGVAATPARSLEKFESTESVDIRTGASPEVSVETISGDITYTGTGSETAEVTITIRIRAEDEAEARLIRKELDIEVEGEDGFLDARVRRPDNFHRLLRREFGRNRSISVSFDISGPRGAEGELTTVSGSINLTHARSMDIQSVSGDVSACDIEGRLRANTVSGGLDIVDCSGLLARAETVSGDLTVENCGRSLSASSVSGSIRALSVRGDADASTVSGDITLREIGGEISASTTSGSINVEHDTGDLSLSTTSGDITARSGSKGSILAKSLSGRIDLAIRPDAIGSVRLSTFSGDIDADAEIRVRKHSRRGLVGTMGDGDGKLEVETHSGDIVLSEL